MKNKYKIYLFIAALSLSGLSTPLMARSTTDNNVYYVHGIAEQVTGIKNLDPVITMLGIERDIIDYICEGFTALAHANSPGVFVWIVGQKKGRQIVCTSVAGGFAGPSQWKYYSALFYHADRPLRKRGVRSTRLKYRQLRLGQWARSQPVPPVPISRPSHNPRQNHFPGHNQLFE